MSRADTAFKVTSKPLLSQRQHEPWRMQLATLILIAADQDWRPRPATVAAGAEVCARPRALGRWLPPAGPQRDRGQRPAGLSAQSRSAGGRPLPRPPSPKHLRAWRAVSRRLLAEALRMDGAGLATPMSLSCPLAGACWAPPGSPPVGSRSTARRIGLESPRSTSWASGTTPSSGKRPPWLRGDRKAHLPTKIILTKICRLNIFGEFPMGLGIPPLTHNIMLQSNPLKSMILVRRLPPTSGSSVGWPASGHVNRDMYVCVYIYI